MKPPWCWQVLESEEDVLKRDKLQTLWTDPLKSCSLSFALCNKSWVRLQEEACWPFSSDSGSQTWILREVKSWLKTFMIYEPTQRSCRWGQVRWVREQLQVKINPHSTTQERWWQVVIFLHQHHQHSKETEWNHQWQLRLSFSSLFNYSSEHASITIGNNNNNNYYNNIGIVASAAKTGGGVRCLLFVLQPKTNKQTNKPTTGSGSAASQVTWHQVYWPCSCRTIWKGENIFCCFTLSCAEPLNLWLTS